MTGTDLALAARVVVALVLVTSGVAKLAALPHTTRRFREDLGGYRWLAYAVALALPVAELLLAVMLLTVDAAWPAWLALLAFAAFTIVLLRRLARRDRRPCNCFGAASNRHGLSPVSLVRNGWFVVLALLATGAATLSAPTAVAATIATGIVLAGISAALVVRT